MVTEKAKNYIRQGNNHHFFRALLTINRLNHYRKGAKKGQIWQDVVSMPCGEPLHKAKHMLKSLITNSEISPIHGTVLWRNVGSNFQILLTFLWFFSVFFSVIFYSWSMIHSTHRNVWQCGKQYSTPKIYFLHFTLFFQRKCNVDYKNINYALCTLQLLR